MLPLFSLTLYYSFILMSLMSASDVGADCVRLTPFHSSKGIKQHPASITDVITMAIFIMERGKGVVKTSNRDKVMKD